MTDRPLWIPDPLVVRAEIGRPATLRTLLALELQGVELVGPLILGKPVEGGEGDVESLRCLYVALEVWRAAE